MEISEALEILLKTVEAHRHNILKKLQVKNTVSFLLLMEESEVSI
jgi:DNA-binding NarL/FixJ family response regulator